MAKVEHPPAHSLTLALPLSLSTSSLSTLSHTQARRGEGRGRKEKGLKLGYSKRCPWRPPRGPHPQEVGVGRGRIPLTLAIRSYEEKEARRRRF